MKTTLLFISTLLLVISNCFAQSNDSVVNIYPNSGTIIYSKTKFNLFWWGPTQDKINAELSTDGGITWDTLARNITGSINYSSDTSNQNNKYNILSYQLTTPVFSKVCMNGLIRITIASNGFFSMKDGIRLYPYNANSSNIFYMDSMKNSSSQNLDDNNLDTITICSNPDSIKIIAMSNISNPEWNFANSEIVVFNDTLFLNGSDTGILQCLGNNCTYTSNSISCPDRFVYIKFLKLQSQNFNISCGNTAKLSLITNYKGNSSVPEYNWTPVTGLSNPNISDPFAVLNGDSIHYKVTMTAFDVCKETANVTLSLVPMNSPAICIVSVDSTNKNVIYWESPVSTSIDSFYIYKETNITNVYDKIGTVSYNNARLFVDTASQPNVQSNKYEISIKDDCGFESAKSLPHKTMHLSINQGQNNSWNLIWEPYVGFDIATYLIYRGTNVSNMQLIGSTSASSNQYTDFNAPSGYVYYQIEVTNPNNCLVSCSENLVSYSEYSIKSDEDIVVINTSTSRSNIATNGGPLAINDKSVKSSMFSIYPNPAEDILNILSNNPEGITNGNIEIIDINGGVVLNTTLNSSKMEINISNLNSGVYSLVIRTDQIVTTQKIVHLR